MSGLSKFGCWQLLALPFAQSYALPRAGKSFDYVMTIQFENHAYDEVINDPNFNKYRAMGRSLTNYFAITHPSQPNYIAQVAGDTMGIADDNVHHLDNTVLSLADLLEDNNLPWKLYQEDYPGDCSDAASINNLYYRKHNPFISFDRVRLNATRCAKIVNADQLDTDLAAGTLPSYSYYTPNINNDAHNTNITFGGKWLDSFLGPRMSQFPKGTLIVVTWDEDDYTEENQVLTFLLDPKGTIFKAGSTDNTKYTHYSLLATIEDNWSLGNLGRNDKTAVLFNFNTADSYSPEAFRHQLEANRRQHMLERRATNATATA